MASPLRILLVEDHPQILGAISHLLSGYGMIVSSVDHGQAVADAIDTLRPDVLITDISMPGRSGFQVLRDLRSHQDALAIVLLTSHDTPLYRRIARQAGADGYVLKQDAVRDLWPVLQSLIKRRGARYHA